MTDIYLDSMSSTTLHPDVLAFMSELYKKFPGNPSSKHCYGEKLQELINIATQQILEAVKSDNYHVIWTSGATEAINTAILGACNFYQRQGQTAITFATEHKVTLEAYAKLNSLGFKTKILDVESSGLVCIDTLLDNITSETILVSICHVNNEIGTIQDIKRIIPCLQSNGCLVHIDAAQSIGKVELNLQKCPADFISISGHKFGGPQGIGALLVRKQPMRQLAPILFGGKQQLFRPGTLPATLICGMGLAAELAKQEQKIFNWQKKIIELFNEVDGITIHGCLDNRVANNLNFYVEGINIETFKYLNQNLAISSGSACNAQNPDPSHVLLALGYGQEHASNSVRISLGNHLTDVDIEQFCQQFKLCVSTLRRISGWQCKN